MKKINPIIIPLSLIITLLYCSCTRQKYENQPDGDLSGNLYIHGRLFYVDNVTTNGNINYFGNTSVKYGYSGTGDSLNYIGLQLADANGYFTFQNIPNGSYHIWADTTINGVKYHANKQIILNNNSIDTTSLMMYPSDSTQNGIVFTVVDSANSGFINNASICIFSVLSLVNDSCNASSYSLTTNPFGKASLFNIFPKTYISVIKLQAGSIMLKTRDTTTVGVYGIMRKTVMLHR